MTIALVTPLVQAAVGHGVLHRAIVLVRVRAIGKPAEAHVTAAGRGNSRPPPRQSRPKAETAACPAYPPRSRRKASGNSRAVVVVWRPFSFSSLTGCTRRCKLGIDGVQAATTCPRRSAPPRTLSRRQQAAEPLDAEAGLRAEQQDLIAHAAVDAGQRLKVGRLDQVDLVDADDGPHAALLGGRRACDRSGSASAAARRRWRR